MSSSIDVVAARDGWRLCGREGLDCDQAGGMTRIRRRGVEPATRISHACGRTVGLTDGRLVEVTGEVTWEGLGDAVRLMRSGERLDPLRLALFEQCGSFFIEAVPVGDRSGEVACACTGITRGEVAALATTCDTRADVARACAAGTACGGCGAVIDEILGSGSMMDAELIDVTALAHGVKRFRFNYVVPVAAMVGGGAFVHVQCAIGDRRISRPYTVTSFGPDGGVEVIVKRDPAGVVSCWLHDHASVDSIFRLSRPQRSRQPRTARSVAFIAAGIGITPALAEVVAATSPTVSIHWSVRGSRPTPLLSAVKAACQAGGARLEVHDTQVAGRVTDWASMVPRGSAEAVVVCGPPAFQANVVASLGEAGWPASDITVESFAPSGRIARTLAHVDSFDYLQEPVVAESFHLSPVGSVRTEAEAFLRQFYFEHGAPKAFEARWREVGAAIEATCTYAQTYEELAFGARLAWRNSARCIGRFFWRSLEVRDLRHVRDEEAVFAAVVEHLAAASNGGDIKPIISVFSPDAPGVRILNPQLILYAGYGEPDGSTLGDPKNVELTRIALDLGWRGTGTAFDVLPVIIQVGDGRPKWFRLPEEVVLEVNLSHPRYPLFSLLGLRWFAVPAVSGMALDVGGIQYTAAPSNGFYMGTEIGSGNLADPSRYDQLPAAAAVLGLDTSEPLWRDQAMLDLNVAVLHSFKKAGVRILDHHSLSEFFKRFREEEALAQRPSYGHWAWVMPPMGGNLSPIWRDNTLRKKILKPNYFYQPLRAAYATGVGCDVTDPLIPA